MIYVTTIVIIILFLVSTTHQKSIANPLSIFLGIWSLISFFAMLQLFDMMDYSNYGPFILLLGVSFVSLGYFTGNKYKIKGAKTLPIVGINPDCNYVIREKLYIFFLGSTIAVYLVILVAVLALYRSGYNASTIREFYRYSGESASSGLATSYIYGGSSALRWLHLYYANPMVFASIALMAVNLTDKAKLTKISILSIIALGLSCIVNFGRFNLIYALACLAVAFFMKKGRLSKKIRKRIMYTSIVAIFAIIILFLVLNRLRNVTSSLGFVKQLYGYFSIEIPLLDYWIDYVNSNNYYSYGFSFISGFVGNLMNVLAKYNISFPAYRVNSLLNYNLVDHFIQIFPDKKYNAYVSMFFAFYLDFREIGVILGSFIYGYVVSRSFKKAKVNNASQAMFLLLFYSLFTSFIRWQFITVSYCFAFIFLRLLIKQEKEGIVT